MRPRVAGLRWRRALAVRVSGPAAPQGAFRGRRGPARRPLDPAQRAGNLRQKNKDKGIRGMGGVLAPPMMVNPGWSAAVPGAMWYQRQ
ncbi:hypothetical protein SAMN02746095_03851 [Acidocella aminolytica 101 = DSM 11237]|nr:hypothetical protein SAMN02746095_03851 [Acidocella aminolytica 101 = DSM 11237]